MGCCTANEPRKLPAAHVGLHADRGCTNCCMFPVFGLFWALMIYVTIVSFQLGNLDRLIYGVDYLGNVCGHGETDMCDGVKDCTVTPDNFAARKYLWYPITFSWKQKTFLIKEALKLGVCVEECPKQGDRVPLYGYFGAEKEVTKSPFPSSGYLSLFDSAPKYNRCVPDFLTFNCSGDDDCDNHKNSSKVEFNALSKLTDALNDGFSEVKQYWWVVLSCVGICIVISFIWLFIMRRTVKPMVVLTMVLAFVALALLGYFLFARYQYFDQYEPNSETKTYYLVGAITAWVVTFIYLCVVIFLGKDIMIACDIIEEASKIPISIPTMVLVPPVMILLLVPFLLYAMFVAANIWTAAKTSTLSIDYPTAVETNTSTSVQFKEYQVENWRVYAAIYNLFMFLWTAGFLHAISFMICAFCAIFWYWSNPGDNKQPEAGVCKGLCLTLANHLGTLMLGSLIVALVQIARVILTAMEHRLNKTAENVEIVKCLMRCAQCCLAYLERFIKFINKNAYIMTAMTGESFLDGGRHALSLLMGNALSVGAVTIIGEYVMIFGKIFITAASAGACYGIMTTQRGPNDGPTTGWLIILCVAIIAYFIACIFLAVFSVCIDSVLLSYCYDLEANNGMDRPYYFPDDLKKHLSRAQERKSKEYEKQHTMKNKEASEPLNS